jgi:outer membrane biosynthesis protein TonB
MTEYLASGRLEDHPFADLAGLIFRESRTGSLALESGGRRRTVWFLGGNPVAVVSAAPEDHLAQLMLEHGRIGAPEAERLAALPETREGLGAVDFVPKDVLNWGVKYRFVNLCYDLFRWEEGDYAFSEGNPPKELFLLKVPAHSLILKGVGYLGHGALVDAVPDGGVFAPGPVAAADARYLGPDERRVLEACSPGRTVDEVLAAEAGDPDQVRRVIHALACLGLLAVSRTPAPEAAPEFGLLEPGFEPPEVDEPAPQGGGSDGGFFLPPEEPPAAPDFSLPPLDLAAKADGGMHFGAAGEHELGAAPFAHTETGTDPFAMGGEEEPAAKPSRAKSAGRSFHFPRLAGVVIGALAAAGIIGGAGWWWMSAEQAPPPVKPPVRKAAPVPVPAPTAAPAPAAAPAAPTPAAPQPPTAQTPAPPPPAAAPAPSPAAAPAPPAPVARPAAPAPAAPAGDRYRNGLEVLRAGDFDAAADIFESVLGTEHRGEFTLLLLTACQHDTIRDAQRALGAQAVYLVSKKVNGRACFRVCVGTYPTREAAGRALGELPGAYRSEGAAVRPVADVLSRDR